MIVLVTTLATTMYQPKKMPGRSFVAFFLFRNESNVLETIWRGSAELFFFQHFIQQRIIHQRVHIDPVREFVTALRLIEIILKRRQADLAVHWQRWQEILIHLLRH